MYRVRVEFAEKLAVSEGDHELVINVTETRRRPAITLAALQPDRRRLPVKCNFCRENRQF